MLGKKQRNEENVPPLGPSLPSNLFEIFFIFFSIRCELNMNNMIPLVLKLWDKQWERLIAYLTKLKFFFA